MAKIGSDHRSRIAGSGSGQKMFGEIDAHRVATSIAQAPQMSSGTAPGIQDEPLDGAGPRKKRGHLAGGLVGIAMAVEFLVERPEPFPEPLIHRNAPAQDNAAARPRTATASSASAGENPAEIQVSALRRRALMRVGLRLPITPKGQPMNSGSTSK